MHHVSQSKRWMVLAVFCLYGLSNQINALCFATIVRETELYFSITSFQANSLNALFPLVYMAVVFPVCSVYESMGLREGVVIGSALNAASGVVKLLSVWIPYFSILVAAQLLAAVSQLFFLSMPPLVASSWFPQHERTVATAVGALSGFVGMAISMYYGPQLVSSHAFTSRFLTLFLSQCTLGVVAWIGNLIVVDDAPPYAPSATAHRSHDKAPPQRVFVLLKQQLRNKNLMIMCLCFGLVNGSYTALAAVLSQAMQPFGVSEDQTGIIALVGILLGSVACAAVAPVVDKYRRYKLPLVVLYAAVGLTSAVALVLMHVPSLVESGGAFVVAAYVLGITLETLVLPAIPVMMEFCVELSYPHPEAIASSLAMAFLSLFTVVGIGVFGWMLGDAPTRSDSVGVMGLLCGVNAVALLLIVVFVREERGRLAVEGLSQAPLLSSQV